MNDCERSEANLLSIATLYSHMGLSNHAISRKLLIFWYDLINKINSLGPYNWYPWWTGSAWPDPTQPGPTQPDPVTTLFEGSILSQFKDYLFEIITWVRSQLQICPIKFWSKNLCFFFEIIAFLVKSFFDSFFPTFFLITLELLYIFKIWIFHMK